MARIFVAMSGGVDSSVAAALLVEQGHDVTGVTMQLWPSGDDEGGCCSVSAVRDARRVCDLLGIPHYALNFRESFEEHVVTPFAHAYARGQTPNPCVVCNDVVKFGDLLQRVREQGADLLATGHYARIVETSPGAHALVCGSDPGKDQSYFLHRMTADQLSGVIFPVGELRKPDVRAIAESIGLAVASKPDSQETCFAADGDYVPVVRERAPAAFVSGDIVDVSGALRGRHDGIGHFTVGQRKGIGIGGGPPLYVVRIDPESNRVTVGGREDLRVTEVRAESVVWSGGCAEDLEVMVRYRMRRQPAHVRYDDGRLTALFTEPLDGVALGQSLVCYRDDMVVGGGVISCAS